MAQDWTTCQACDLEFKVITPELDAVAFCPFCGTQLEEEELPDDEEWED